MNIERKLIMKKFTVYGLKTSIFIVLFLIMMFNILSSLEVNININSYKLIGFEILDIVISNENSYISFKPLGITLFFVIGGIIGVLLKNKK